MKKNVFLSLIGLCKLSVASGEQSKYVLLTGQFWFRANVRDHLRILLCGVICLLFPIVSFALDYSQLDCGDADSSTFCAATCDRANVLAAYNATTSDSTVYVPAGTCDWSGGTSTAINVEKSNISFIGAGIDKTIIKAYSTSDYPNKLFMYHVAKGSSTFWRISGFTFTANDDCSGDSCSGGKAAVYIYRTANFRFDHNKLDGYFGGPAIQFKSINKGLFDNNTFINRKVSASGSYYGMSGGQPYDGDPNPISHDPNNPSALPRCNKTTSPDLQCACQAGLPASERSSSVSSGNTVIAGGSYDSGGSFSAEADIKYNGIPDTGTVRRIYIHVASVVGANPSVTIASFSGTGNTFSARARSSALPVEAGSNIFTVDDGGFSPFAIHDGDYIGVYLNNCTLSSSDGNTSWTINGDQTANSSVNFGSPDVGGVSLWTELYDDSGRYASCEEKWDTWYTDEATRSPHFEAFNRDWEYDEDAIYFEDNYFSWTKSGLNLNWGASSRIVVRFNTFDTATGSVTWTKPGNNYGIWHNNVFNYTGSSNAYVFFLNTDALIYNNTFNNYNKMGSPQMYRSFSDAYFPFSVRPKEIFTWGNTCVNCTAGCDTSGDDESNCYFPRSGGNEGIYWTNDMGENGAFHARHPQIGDRLYDGASTCSASQSESNPYGVSTPSAECYIGEYTYPHPLTLDLDSAFIVDGVNPSCRDSGPGTEDEPFCTVQQGADVVSAGETVYIKDGNYPERVEVQNTGSPGKYITFTAYPGHSPHITGDGTCGWNGVFNIEGKQYIKVDSIEMSRQSCYDNNSAGWIIYVASGEYIEISNVEAHHPGSESEHIQVLGASSNVKINKNILRDGKCPSGIDVYTKNGSGYEAGRPSDIEIAYNTVYNVNPSFSSCGIGAGIATERVDRAHVHHNIVYDSRMGLDIGCGKNNDIHDNDIKDCETGIAISGNEYSEIYKNSIDGSSDEGFLSYDHEDHPTEVHANNTWHSNTVTNSYIPFQEYNKPSQGAAATSTGHKVFNNLFYKNNGPVRLLDSRNMKFYHNTVYANNGASGVQIGDDGATNVELINNVISISGNRSAISMDNYAAPTIEIGFNLLFNRSGETVIDYNGTTYTESDVNDDTFYSATGNGQNSIAADPLLDSAYRPDQGSPAIDTGTNVSVTEDLDGNARPIDGDTSGASEYDIGAYEYLGVSAPTCLSEGYTCCTSCATGSHPQYDATCSNQVCCESCAAITEICDNTSDDDSDGLVDCNDPDCEGANHCIGEDNFRWMTPVAIESACDSQADLTIDSDTATIWHHWPEESHFVVFDLGRIYEISRLRIYHEKWAGAPKAITSVTISRDGRDFSENLGTLTVNNSDETGWKQIDFENIDGRYVRVESEITKSTYWREFEFLVTDLFAPRNLRILTQSFDK